MKIILASASPRRCELLQQIGLEFVQATVAFAEIKDDKFAFTELVTRNACGKAKAVAADICDIVLGADTVVVLGEKIIGKPQNSEHARFILRQLAGRTHKVLTGVCVRRGDNLYMATETTLVTMRSLSEREIASYVATGEPFDKAGAYGIQGKGSLLVEKVNGCYFNVVGLPLVCLRGLLKKAGFLFDY